MDQRRLPRKGGSSAAPGRGPRPNDAPRPRRPRSSHPTPKTSDEGADRLQKILAHAGIDSRRACEELILKGRVTVNGKIVRELGTKVDARKATIAVDGEKIESERMVYYAVYKPKGYVSTNADPSGRPRVLDILPEIPQRVYTVGRLDEMSNGLILLTNDGNLAHQLAHPKYGVEKLYRVVVAGMPSPEVLKQLTDGIWLAEGKVRAKRVRAVGRRGESTILEMVLSEGKNREVRRMLAKLGHKVMSLTRIAVGPISIKGLSSGQYRSLTSREVMMLRKAAAGEFISPFPTDRKRTIKPPDRPRPAAASPGDRERPPQRPGSSRPTGPAMRPPATGGRPQGPAPRPPGRRPEPDRIAPPVGGDFEAPRIGRRVIGMDPQPAAPTPTPRPRPTGKRPPLKTKPPRRAPGPLKPRRGRRDEGGG